MFLLLFGKYSLCNLDTISWSDTWLENIFSHFVGVFFFQFIDAVLSTEILNFNQLQFVYFFFCHFCSWWHKKLWPNSRLQILLLCFLREVLYFTGTLNIYDPFLSSFSCMVVKHEYKFIILHVDI